MIIPETAKAEDANILRQGESFVIDDFARMTPVSFGYLDSYILNIPAKGEDDFGGQKIVKAEKGAEFALLRVDIDNLQMEDYNFSNLLFTF